MSELFPGMQVHMADGVVHVRDTFLWVDEGWYVEVDWAAIPILLKVVNDPAWDVAQRYMLSQPWVDRDKEEMLSITEALRGTPEGYGVRFLTGSGGLILLAGTLSSAAEEHGVDRKTGDGLIEWFECLADGDRLAFGSWSMFWNRVTMSAGAAMEASASREHHSRITRAASTYRRPGEKLRRNDPCPCRSGKKYKRCCGRRIA